ncbi:Ca-activated chloride channel family protein [Rheinheimera pacifica]|uniref:Ca-activated chloride channel family protein n=1 Tax=Rheinheimera pacifica TaxID=173990 RepID=A0A1H6K834_9GAMM|nr:VWA domain-containing protein [Rheinheimera pacifica]SEH71608.1 Ca-activated chloride channel family protein [Rheinheimera pacifica]
MLADFHFLRPLWLLAALPVLLFTVLLYYYRREQSPWHSLIAPHLQQVLLGGQLLIKKQPLALPLLLLCWLTTTLALAGPSWQKLPQPAFALKKATVLVLDMSLSMRATDMAPDRLTQQRFAALDFTQQLKEGELALLSFAGDAFVISPLTPDHNNIRLLIPDLKPEIMPAQGSNLLAALQQADKLLRQAGYIRGDVVVFTDGFDNNSLREMQDLLNNWPHRLSVLGFGTEAGAPVKLESGELLKSATGAVVVPKLPQAQLAALAKRSGGVYVQATASANALDDLLNLPALSALDQADTGKQIQGDQWQDNAVYLVWLLLPLLLLQRKYSSLLSLGVLMLLPYQIDAVEWRDLWQTKQQQAKQDYASGDFAAAQQKFTDPLWQGNAAYRSGDYATAEQAFRQAAEQNPGADALHNLGNSLAQQQRYEEALAAYQQALQHNKDFTPAQQNADLMQQLLQQQEQEKQQQEQQDQQQQDGDKQQQQDADGESQSDDSSQSDADADSESQQQQSEQQQQNAEPEQQEQPEPQQMQAEEEAQADEAEQQQQQAVHEAWPNATPEEQQQLDNLLRKVQDDPALLLRNKMYLEYLKRQQQRLPKGVDEQW